MNEIMKERYGRLGPVVAANLEKRGFEACYAADEAEAKAKILELIDPAATVSYGGSMTLNHLEIKEALLERGNNLLHRDAAKSAEEKSLIEHHAFMADWYLTSTNALTEDGQLMNVDNLGNRVAALIYGPKNVIVVAGMNKVVHSVEDAYSRARRIAAPANMVRFPGRNTPCAFTGTCSDCNSPDCLCNQVVFTRRCFPPKRIKVILIGQDIGL